MFDCRSYKNFVYTSNYRKFPKYLDTQKICCNHSKIWTMWLYHRVMSPNDADGMANSVDPDQTAPLGAVWSGSALFAQAYLSENLGSLWYSDSWTLSTCSWLVVTSDLFTQWTESQHDSTSGLFRIIKGLLNTKRATWNYFCGHSLPIADSSRVMKSFLLPFCPYCWFK